MNDNYFSKSNQLLKQSKRNLFNEMNEENIDDEYDNPHPHTTIGLAEEEIQYNLKYNHSNDSLASSHQHIPETPTHLGFFSNSGREIGRTTSYDISQFAGAPKKLKPSPCDINDMPDTPQKGYQHAYEDTIPEYSRLYKDYEIIDILGSGSFGTVYRVKGKLDGIGYAIKKSRRRPHSQHERASMMLEVQALAALSAQEDSEQTNCIVRYYSAWTEDEYLCIQMELCESSASDLATFDHQSAFRLLRDMFTALDVLHSNDFVHLDIKPANILMKRNRYKLADFGLALHTTNRKFNGNVEEGDSRYMARELLNWGGVADLTKCDIFSLGISVYELYTRSSLEPNGPKWHALRDGLIKFPSNSHAVLISLISLLMSPDPNDRPSAQLCLQNFTELKTPLEIELEKQKLKALQLEHELQLLLQAKQSLHH